MSAIFFGEATQMTDVLRQSARKQLDSYANAWIMMFELLQNALDAVEKNSGEKKILLQISPSKREIIVSDNGAGFPASKDYFALGKGNKGELDDYTIRGEHGVGMKMVILCSESFELWTKTTEGKIWKATFSNGFKYLKQGETESFEPDAKDSIIPPGFVTTVRVKFPLTSADCLRHIDVREELRSIFNRYETISPHAALSKKARFELAIEHYFRTSSYTGDVNRLFDAVTPATIEVSIEKDSELSNEQLAKTYPAYVLEHWEKSAPVVFPAKYWDPLSWFENPELKGMRTLKDLKSFNPSIPTPNHLWALKLTKPEEYKLLLDNPHVKDKYPAGEFEYLLTKKIRGIYLLIGSAASNSKYNINSVMVTSPDHIIAADGVLTTNQIRTPKRGKNQNYLNNIHFIVNIADRVNYGKQGVKNPVLLGQLYAFFEEIYVKKITDLASSVAGKKTNDGGPPTPGTTSIIDLPDLDEPDLSIKKAPAFESTLIALTHELLAKARIKGISAYQLSTQTTYDCFGLMTTTSGVITPSRDSDLANIEYKVRIMDLIDDIELGNKSSDEIHLAIVWDDKLDSAVTGYGYLELESSSCEKVRITGVDKVLRRASTGDEIPVLTVAQLVKVRALAAKAKS